MLGLVPDYPVPLDLVPMVDLAVPSSVPLRVGLQLDNSVADLPSSLARVVPLIPYQRHLFGRDHYYQRFGFVLGPQLFPHRPQLFPHPLL